MLPLSEGEFDLLWESFLPHPSILENAEIYDSALGRTAQVVRVSEDSCLLSWHNGTSDECRPVALDVALMEWKTNKAWQPLGRSQQNSFAISFFDLFNWTHTQGLLMLKCQHGITDYHMLEQIGMAWKASEWDHCLPAHHRQMALQQLSTQILPFVLVPLRDRRDAAQLCEQKWRVSGLPQHDAWVSQISRIKQEAAELQKAQCQWWMLYCPAANGKLHAVCSNRHTQRLRDLLPEV
jgi:hypothetical protein